MNLARRLSIAIALVAAIGRDMQAQGQPGPGRPTVGIFAGPTFPLGALKNDVAAGWNAGVLAKMRVYGPLDIRGDGTYSKFGRKKDIPGDIAHTFATDANARFGTLTALLNLGADSAAYSGDRTNSPYLFGGFGRYRLDLSPACVEVATGGCTGIQFARPKTHNGVNLGFGVSIPFIRLRTMVEIRYHRISLPLEEGGTRSMLTAAAGLKIR